MIRRVGANSLLKPNSKISFKRLLWSCLPITFPWIRYESIYLFREIILDPQSTSLTHYELSVYFANVLWMNYLLREVTINPLPYRSIHYQGPSLNSLWIHYLFCVFTLNLISSLSILQWSMKLFFVREIIINTLCVSLIYSGFTYFKYIHYANNIAQWFFWQIRYRFIIFSGD